MAMSRIFVPTRAPEDWQTFLAEPEKQWRTGFSARTLAYCWEAADGFPVEVSHVFEQSSVVAFEQVELLLAFPEYKVALPGGGTASQNDLFVLARNKHQQLITIMVEGKVAEPFGQSVGVWFKGTPSAGKQARLQFIKDQLQLSDVPSEIRYQLLHRAVSAVIEAKRFGALSAVMLVHSFSKTNQWFEDFQNFVGLFGASATINRVSFLKTLDEVNLYAAWVHGDERFLNV